MESEVSKGNSMRHRIFAPICLLTTVIVVPLSAQAQNAASKAPAAKSKTWTVPRAPDGHPDLQGVWTNATLTPVERPAQFAGKVTVSEAEAKTYEKSDLETNDIDNPEAPLLARAGSGSGETAVGGYNNLFIDRGSSLAVVDGGRRTSLIIDPADGKIPVRDGAARVQRAAPRVYDGAAFDDVKTRPLSERCIIGFGSTAGPPMMPALYNNNYEIVQTPDAIMILVEMVHDVRIIHMNAAHKPAAVKEWFGDSVGHWDGDTLVVETTNLHEGNRFRGGSENMRVTERFKRIDAKTMLYRATIDDPERYKQPWTLEYPFNATPGPVYEYACHEGNYSITDILGGARKMETEAIKK
jgi:hypothetical protein